MVYELINNVYYWIFSFYFVYILIGFKNKNKNKNCSNNYEIYCVRCFGFFIYMIYSSKN